MKDRFKSTPIKWAVIGGLLLLLNISSASFANAAGLTDTEKFWLTYMREEEKLARDVYRSLYKMWRLPIFDNISKSEQTHMNAIKTLLDRYALPDPAAGNDAGIFTNREIQALYDELIQRGSISVVEALSVGVVIELKDIDDLTSGLASTTRRDITNVFTNLRQGSLNHLTAFKSNLVNY